MKSILHPLLLLSTVAAIAAAVSASPASPAAPADPAAQLLQRHGSIAVANVGEHIEAGSFRVHVSARLGRPDAVLPDGSWLYHRRRVADSAATGTLVVRFNTGRVSELRLAAPALAAALPPAPADSPLVAIK